MRKTASMEFKYYAVVVCLSVCLCVCLQVTVTIAIRMQGHRLRIRDEKCKFGYFWQPLAP